MATDPGTIEFLVDQLGPRRAAYSTKRMFGEYCLYHDGVPVAFVCDDVLFVKDTAPGREAIATAAEPAFGPPYPGAKPYLRIAPDLWDDGDWLVRVLEATAAALPRPKPRAPKGDATRTKKAATPRAATRRTDTSTPRRPKTPR
ncbi:TfoX/Sxy family protein [Lysobacter xanthus]